jgi:hypothetical protein
MNFIKAVLGGVDTMWSLLTIPLLLIVGVYFIYYLPLLTLIAMSVFIWGETVKANYMQSIADTCSDPEDIAKFSQLKRNCDFNAGIYVIATVIAFSVFIYLIVTTNEICRDVSDFIPGTLPGMLQKVVPHTCS